MRLVQQGDKVGIQFTTTWEVTYLAEQGERWVPFTLPGKTDPIGKIHASTHQVCLFSGHLVSSRQAVTLCIVPPPEGITFQTR
jgi:hypothetical protein